LGVYQQATPAAMYWQKRCRLTSATWAKINWPLFHHTMHEISLAMMGEQICVWLFLHRKNMQWWQFQNIVQYPWYHALIEDKPHVIKCPSQVAWALWQSSLAKLKLWLIDQRMVPNLVDDLILGLNSWHDGPPPSLLAMLMPIRQDTQQEIGWEYALDGWLSLQWHCYWA